MEQEKINKLAKKMEIVLDENNRAVLNLKITDDSNFLSPFYYDEPIISNDVAEYITINKRILLWKYGVTINLISDVIDEKEKPIFQNAIKSYFQHSLTHQRRRQKSNYLLSIVLFIIGVLIFCLMFILDFYFSDSLGLWKEVIDVVAWVFIWESVDIAFIQKIENSVDLKIAKNIVDSNIIFNPLTTSHE